VLVEALFDRFCHVHWDSQDRLISYKGLDLRQARHRRNRAAKKPAMFSASTTGAVGSTVETSGSLCLLQFPLFKRRGLNHFYRLIGRRMNLWNLLRGSFGGFSFFWAFLLVK
jgi:hypothetical protein